MNLVVGMTIHMISNYHLVLLRNPLRVCYFYVWADKNSRAANMKSPIVSLPPLE